MTWLTPLVGGIAAAILVPSLIILYFLKLRRRDVEVSTTLLWKKSIEDLQANAPFQKLRRNLLLLLQLLILGAGLFALAQPQFMADRAIGAKHVILIDRSASMSSTDANDAGTQSRLDAAKLDAVQLVESLRTPGLFSGGVGDQAMVIAFDMTAEVRQRFTTDKAALIAAIESIAPTDSRSSLDQAVRVARAHAVPRTIIDERTGSVIQLPSGPVGTIHVYSDGRLRDLDKAETDPDDVVKYHPIGKTDAINVGITALRADRSFNDPTKLSIFVSLTSTDPNPRMVDVEVLIDGAPQRIREVEVPGMSLDLVGMSDDGAVTEASVPAHTGTTFEFDRPQSGEVTVRLDPRGEDVLASDNRAWAVVPPAKRLTIAMVGGASYVLQKALGSLRPNIELIEIAREDLVSATERLAADVYVLDGWLPEASEWSDDPLPPGRWLIFGAAPGPPLGLTRTGESERAIILNWSREHPALRGINFANAGFGEVTTYEIGEESIAEVLATSEVGPAIVEMTTARMHAIVVAYDVGKSIWWQDLSFPLFVGKAVRYLGEDDGEGVARMVRPGDTYSDRLPQGAGDVRVESPIGESTRVTPGDDGRIVYGPVRYNGVYTIRWDGQGGPMDSVSGGRAARSFTANLLDPAETDARTAASLNLPTQLVAGEFGDRAASTVRLWPWLLLGGLGVLMLEWFIYNRKVYV
jgi:hypothetical protein